MSLLCLSLILTATNCILSFANQQIILSWTLVGLILLNILLIVTVSLGLPANVKHLRNSLIISVISWLVQDVVVVMQFLQSKLYIELIGCFLQLLIVFITAYEVYFIWQLWKEVSFNGEFRRTPANLGVPSISWSVEQHDNRGYEEDLKVASISSALDTNPGSLTHNVEQSQSQVEAVGPRLEMEAEAVIREFECPVCLSVMVGGIMQCGQGHCVCSQCVARGVITCPLCRDNIQGRAVNMENIARILFHTSS